MSKLTKEQIDKLYYEEAPEITEQLKWKVTNKLQEDYYYIVTSLYVASHVSNYEIKKYNNKHVEEHDYLFKNRCEFSKKWDVCCVGIIGD